MMYDGIVPLKSSKKIYYKTKSPAASVCLNVLNSKTTQHMKMKFGMETVSRPWEEHRLPGNYYFYNGKL